MTVFFVQQPSPYRPQPNLTTAQIFGECKFIFAFDDRVSQDPDEHYLKAVSALTDFDPAVDFLADCGGDKMSLGVASHVLARKGILRVPFLRWCRYDGGYYEETYIGC